MLLSSSSPSFVGGRREVRVKKTLSLSLSLSSFHYHSNFKLGFNCHNYLFNNPLLEFQQSLNLNNNKKISLNRNGCFVFCCSADDSAEIMVAPTTTSVAPLVKKRKRYRKLYPGESKGIVEEMRFVAMKLRNDKTNKKITEEEGGGGEREEIWQPSIKGFLNYLVDSKLVFETLERIVDESDDVNYAYFRKTGLERSEVLSKDIELISQQDLVIPQPSSPGVSYARYLEELAEKSAPMFLCHFYNIYFAHISGGQVIAKQVSEKLLEGRELEFCRWEGDELELLKDVRDKLNQLGEHWSRDEKNKCLREATKSFRFLGHIVRLIIL
ncbi:hypothetical protein AQUCO_01500123v1 [Aquilegia coerulea]|uniref:Heme oxygenase 1 n=1 Tax=Aquilegia coerulea TaxID=218851 RepID=A0A2G5DS71_AQUCA|nr:hypothetical protein AQUCO_01500123v1 [Aquilegia coerulea]